VVSDEATESNVVANISSSTASIVVGTVAANAD
jgi:hypothetical protein